MPMFESTTRTAPRVERAGPASYGHGSDVVRRLIARPIRMQAVPRPLPPLFAPATAVPEASAPAHADPAASEAAPLDNARRLQVEAQILKAALRAIRRENETLRACIGLDGAAPSLGAEARAERDRWIAVVERLLRLPA